MMAEISAPLDSRAWLTAVLDEGGARLKTVRDAGATSPEVTWDVADVRVTAKLHGGGVTISTRAADGTEPVAAMTVPASWLDPALNGES